MLLIGKQPVQSTTRSVDVDLFLGDLFISYADPADKHHYSFRDIRFLELRLTNFDLLTGRDVLALGLFQMNGKTNQFTFAW
jgi:hypothetical protein